MDSGQEEFLKSLLEDFKVEAAEHRQAIVSGLLELEKAPTPERQRAIVESIFREAHSLKGAARAVNLPDIGILCQGLENVFALLKKGELAISVGLFDTLQAGMDSLDGLLSGGGVGGAASGLTAVLKRLEAVRKDVATPAPGLAPKISPAGAPAQVQAPAPPPAPREEPAPRCVSEPDHPPHPGEKVTLQETVRISTTKLGALLRQAEELVSVKSMIGFHAAELRELLARQMVSRKATERDLAAEASLPQGRQAPRDDSPGGEEHRAKTLEGDMTRLARTVEQHHRLAGRMVDDLLADIKKTLMLPFSSLLGLFPKLVRDIARDRGKEISLEIHGGDVEIDRRILEGLKDPLIHIARNVIDHGIEVPEVRTKNGKPAAGAMTIAVCFGENQQVSVRISDDGAGIDTARLKASAIRLGVIDQQTADQMSEAEALHLIFRSGVSTSGFITDLSGRGLGMAIVAENVTRLGGTISVESRRGAGTTFTLVLPLTLAAFRGVLVRVGEQLLVVPTTAVERAIRATPEEIKTVGNHATIARSGHVIAFVHLGEVLGIAPAKIHDPVATPAPVLVLAAAEKRMAFAVDEVLGEQEGIVKGLGPQLRRVKNIGGVIVLGSGRLVPIVNVSDLMETATRMIPGRGSSGVEEAAAEKKMTSILIADDSITSRSLLRNIVETAGYQVRTVVDGVEALAELRSGEYDLLVSDVEMPGLTGFELVAKIRSDKRLADLPVILVTGLGSPEDRLRGVEAGANAYIVKSDFEQSNLLEAIGRLI